MAEKKLTITDLRDQLTQLVDAGFGDKTIMFGAGGESERVGIEGGIMSNHGLLLAPLKLDRVGGF